MKVIKTIQVLRQSHHLRHQRLSLLQRIHPPPSIKHDLFLFLVLHTRCSPSIHSSLIKSKRIDTRITLKLDCSIRQWRQYKREWSRGSETSGRSSSRCHGACRDAANPVRERSAPLVQLVHSDAVEELCCASYRLHRSEGVGL